MFSLSPVVSFDSQPEMLVSNLVERGVRVGQVIRATLSSVSVESSVEIAPTIYFCSSELEVERVLIDGEDNDAELPLRVVVRGLQFPSMGFWNVASAIIDVRSDAVLVTADEQTCITEVAFESVEVPQEQEVVALDAEVEMLEDVRAEEEVPVLAGV